MNKETIKTILFFLVAFLVMYLYKQIEYKNAREFCKGKQTKNYIEGVTGIKQIYK
jgi:hypothetical protein